MEKLSTVSKVGLIGGFLFFVHALIPNSHAWPLLWPGLAGIFLVAFLKRKNRLPSFGQTAKSLFKTGVLSASFFFVSTILVLYLLNFPEFNKVGKLLGADGSISFNAPMIFGLLMASGLGTAIAIISGSLFYPFLKGKNKSNSL